MPHGKGMGKSRIEQATEDAMTTRKNTRHAPSEGREAFGRMADVTQLIEEISVTNPQEILRRADVSNAYGTMELYEELAEMVGNFRVLRVVALASLSREELGEIYEHARDAVSILLALTKYKPTQESAVRDKQELFVQLRANNRTWDPRLTALIGSGAAHIAPQTYETPAMTELHRIKNIGTEVARMASDATGEINYILSAARSAAAQAGVASSQVTFGKAAASHKRSGYIWLVSTCIVGLVAAYWGLCLYFGWWLKEPDAPMNASQIVNRTVAKLIVLSAIYYLLVWCGKSYAAHRHNHVVNMHRQNALLTFEVFAKAAGDDRDTKNAVLLQATKSIFAPQVSGYVAKESESDKTAGILGIIGSASAHPR
jgi:hypothetical protein